MGEILKALLVPHPPIMVPEVGGVEVEKVSATVESLRQMEGQIKLLQPDTLVVITPHGAVFSDGLAVTTANRLQGDLGQFGAGQITFDFPNNLPLARAIVQRAEEGGISTLGLDEQAAARYGIDTGLDHGIMVPFYYLARRLPGIRLVPIAIGMLSYLELYRFGMALADSIKESENRVVLIASGDLSHRLTETAPAGYDPRGLEFDREISKAVDQFDVTGLLSLPEDLIEAAGECGLRPLWILLGSLDGFQVKTRVMSYEAPFGVGYMVADFQPGIYAQENRRHNQLKGIQERLRNSLRQQESLPVSLARRTLESYIKEGRIPEFRNCDVLLRQQAGAFVSLKKDGRLRGCIGTTVPTQRNLALEITHNAISAGTRDPRFNPVAEEELPYITYSVDVLQPSERISSLEELDPRRFGVIVRSGRRTGLLLPDLEGIDTAEEQVAIAKEKAGIAAWEPCEMERFEVERFK